MTEAEITKQINSEMTSEQLADRWKPANTNSQNLTIEKLQSFLPKNSNTKVTQAVLDTINKVEQESGMSQELFEEQVCSYAHLIGPGISFEKLMNAIKFVTLRNVTGKQSNAYRIVFPNKSDELDARGATVDNFASMYASTKAVVEVQKLTMLGVNITHAPLRNQIIKKYVDLMNGIGAKPDDYVSPTVQLNATIAADEMTKMPEDNTIELKMGMSDSALEVQKDIAEQLRIMSQGQVASYAANRDISKVQRLNIVHEVEIND